MCRVSVVVQGSGGTPRPDDQPRFKSTPQPVDLTTGSLQGPAALPPMHTNTPRDNVQNGGSPESSIAHLRGLVQVTRLLRGARQLSSVLDAIAHTVCESL